MKMIGDKLKALLGKKRIQSKELGEMLGVTKVTVSHWTNNYSNPSYEKLEEICRVLDVPITYWFAEDVSGITNASTVNGDGSASSIYGDAIVAGELATYKIENEHLKAMLEEKERLIQVLLEKTK